MSLQFSADDRPVYPTGEYLCVLTAIRSGSRVPFGVNPETATEEQKEPCAHFDFNYVYKSEPFVGDIPNVVMNDKTQKAIVFTITTGIKGGHAKSGLRRLLERMAGRTLSNDEVRRLDTDKMVKSDSLFILTVVKTQNKNLEDVNKIETVQPYMQVKKHTFIVDKCLRDLSEEEQKATTDGNLKDVFEDD